VSTCGRQNDKQYLKIEMRQQIAFNVSFVSDLPDQEEEKVFLPPNLSFLFNQRDYCGFLVAVGYKSKTINSFLPRTGQRKLSVRASKCLPLGPNPFLALRGRWRIINWLLRRQPCHARIPMACDIAQVCQSRTLMLQGEILSTKIPRGEIAMGVKWAAGTRINKRLKSLKCKCSMDQEDSRRLIF
jgi:hypothetical protein